MLKGYTNIEYWQWLPPASVHSCARLIAFRYTQCNSDFDGCSCVADIVLQFPYRALFKCPHRKFLWGHLRSMVYKSNPHTIWELKDIIHAVAAITVTMSHRVYLNMVTARLLINYSNTLSNIHTNARENTTRTRAKRKAGYFFVAHSVYMSFDV
jgi:hypothetical protein